VAERVWDRFLTERDHAAKEPAVRKGAGTRPVLLMVDLYRWVFGDRPEPLLQAIERWPGSCGLAAWNALPHLQRILASARSNGIPVVHATNTDDIPSWFDARRPADMVDEAAKDRRRRKFDFLEEIAPLLGEVVLKKTSPSAFNQTPLLHLLRSLDADTLIVAGESTSGCVRATVVDGKSYRYKVLVAEECVFDRHEAPHAMSLFDLEQKYADVLPIDDVVAYMDRIGLALVPTAVTTS
jgi:nicotinamidase-related amidase